LALTNLFIQKPDEALQLLIVKLASGFIDGFRVFQRTCLFLIKPSLQAPLIRLAGASGALMAEEIEADRQPAVQNLLYDPNWNFPSSENSLQTAKTGEKM